jgi:hypothetical protein
VDANYYVAHQNHWVVKVSLTKCEWLSPTLATLTATSGVVSCAVSDTVVDQASGAVVTASALPFAWTRNGQQPPAEVAVTLINGTWLVRADYTANPL